MQHYIIKVTWSVLEKLPQTRLGKIFRCETYAEVLELADG